MSRAAEAGRWRRAFAKQALSDFEIYDLLRSKLNLPACHRLHFLQMAAEKACKAYLLSLQSGSAEVSLQHNVIEKVVSLQLRQARFESFAGSVRRRIRTDAYQLDRLAPAVDRIARPDNTECPWLGPGGIVFLPCEYPFHDCNDQDRGFLDTLKLLRSLAERLVL